MIIVIVIVIKYIYNFINMLINKYIYIIHNIILMNNTYFIHLKKDLLTSNDTSYENLLNLIKNNIDNEEEIMIDNIKILDKDKNIDIDLIGKTLKNTEIINCSLCNKRIKMNSKYKILDCNDIFHIKCINNYLLKSEYKTCPCCNIENISKHIKSNNINNLNINNL